MNVKRVTARPARLVEGEPVVARSRIPFLPGSSRNSPSGRERSGSGERDAATTGDYGSDGRTRWTYD